MGLFGNSGGGFTGKLTGLTFESKEWPGAEGKKPYSTLTAKLVIEKDGADDPIEQFVPAGFFRPERGHAISDDGETLEGGAQVDAKSEMARLIGSAVEKGVDEADLLDADNNGTNFSALLNRRYEFGREINKEKQLASGRKKLGKVKAASATEEELMVAGRQQDKKDKKKFYNHNTLVITAVLGEAEVTKKGVAKAAAPKVAVAKKGVKAAEVDYEEADAILVEMLTADKKQVIPRARMNSAVVVKSAQDDWEPAKRDSYRKLFADEAYLGREAGWTYDGSDKNQPVALA